MQLKSAIYKLIGGPYKVKVRRVSLEVSDLKLHLSSNYRFVDM